MRIDHILATASEPVFSFEFFPPKTEEGERNLFAALAQLRNLDPAFVSVTWGAGGSTRAKTIDIVSRIRTDHNLEAMAHFTCVGATTDELRADLDRMHAAGIDNVLTLRGDPPAGSGEFVKTPGGLGYGSELAALVCEEYDFCVVGACYPETHPEAPDCATDIENLKRKVQAGAKILITQLFYDNEAYFDFVDRARGAGIDVPIIPGIMPLTNAEKVKTFGASLPEPLLEQLDWRANEPEAVVDLGVAYATLQCAELLARGAPGIHFYTLNRSPVTRAIVSALKLLRPWEANWAAPGPAAATA